MPIPKKKAAQATQKKAAQATQKKAAQANASPASGSTLPVPAVSCKGTTEKREGGNSSQKPPLQPHWPWTPSTWSGTSKSELCWRFWMNSVATKSTARSKMRRLRWRLADWPVWASLGEILRVSEGASNGCSGPYQGETFAEWASAHGIRIGLIPRGAHHRLGIPERNHAVRRKMLEVFKQEMPDCTFDKALQVTCHQREIGSALWKGRRLLLWHLDLFAGWT